MEKNIKNKKTYSVKSFYCRNVSTDEVVIIKLSKKWSKRKTNVKNEQKRGKPKQTKLNYESVKNES
jgi:hypothetical protein